MRRLIFGLVFAAVLTPAGALAFGEGGDGGCCDRAVIARLAEAHGVDGDFSLETLDRLENEKGSDLSFMKNSKTPACETYAVCDRIAESFFQILVQGALDRQSERRAEKLEGDSERRDRRSLAFSLVGAVLGSFGFGLSLYNTWRAKK